MKNRYDLVMFDWDGTLFDSVSIIIDTYLATAKELQLNIPSRDEVRSYIGLNVVEYLQELFPGADKKTFFDCYQKHKAINFSNLRLFDGSIDVLNRLHKDGYMLAVATSRYRRDIDNMLVQLGLTDMFSAVRGADDGHPKPEPGMLWSILDEVNVLPKRAIMVGDSDHDMNLAKNANVDAIAVSYGAQTKDKMLLHNPVKCIDDIKELSLFLSPFAESHSRE